MLSVVIVMSNDRVLPHDVTTKDDLFYQVNESFVKPERLLGERYKTFEEYRNFLISLF